ncbi:hypothetical protein H9X85_10155 [Anaerotignum lactatifermentans]|uniref:GINS subunit domain-containing protein n=1 Tax=Anaerotignum lactatifermentans TaxID=160404 RepID=A0ABS2GA90_9FIRM|nr:hypothetical protein [Anaerotignum lactatifermentans]MBM6829904.1 hypothetical protein [Anaerotignum lactatifermentans]MBM6878406.1 hypothetical protein [Anaerotignum lactatifermentans]MBM6951561.1 hypothetical protein [Anaerotignum lactatifermentans]
MEEKDVQWTELLQGAEGLQMLRRVERLRRLMGGSPPAEQAEPPAEGTSVFDETKGERMLFAAIPFLDQEYQKDLYVVVRLMQMRRVLEGSALEARSRREESPALRRRKLLAAIRPCLSGEESRNLDLILKVMEVRQILQKKENGYGIYMGKTGDSGAGGGTSAPAAGSAGKK